LEGTSLRLQWWSGSKSNFVAETEEQTQGEMYLKEDTNKLLCSQGVEKLVWGDQKNFGSRQ
jgi:hypothetical protein